MSGSRSQDGVPEQGLEALVASEQMFRLAMDTASIGMFICRPDGVFERVNPALCSMLGYRSHEDLVGLGFVDVTHPDDVERSAEVVSRLRSGEEQRVAWRKRYLTADGATVWVDLSVAAVHDGEGRHVHTIGQAVDVTAEVAAFEALQRSVQDFRLLAEHASDVVMRVDPTGAIDWVSPSVRQVLGWDAQLLVGTPVLSIVHPDDRELVLRTRATALEGVHHQRVLVRYLTVDGQVRELSGSGHPIPAHDGGGVSGIVVGLRDVTEEQRIRRELAFRASHDSLTGVPNRDDMVSRLRERLALPALAPGRVGVLYCDVDNLKQVNDEHGHPAGDAVLTEVAQRLTSALRAQDVVARVGGDEFVVLLHEVADADQLAQLAERCLQVVVGEIEVDGGRVPLSVSVGATLADPQDDADEVLARADRALLRAKRDGRRRVHRQD